MMETSYAVNNRPPIKEIALAVSLLVFGTLGIILGVIMAANKIGGDRAHGLFFYFSKNFPFSSASLFLRNYRFLILNYYYCFSSITGCLKIFHR